MLMDAPEIEPQPIEIDLRPCQLCGCTIDHHDRFDTPEGPEFFCDDYEREIYLRTCAMVRDWELNDPRDSWRHTGETKPAATDFAPARPAHHTPQATVDAFWCVVRLDDPERLTDWFERHPLDAPYLCELWERKNARS
jgi:hypothetical protein